MTNHRTIGINTAIKDIAGVHNLSVFYSVFENMTDVEESLESFIYQQLSDIRSDKTRKKIAWAINNSLLSFRNDDHRDLIHAIYSNQIPALEQSLAFFWHFLLSNKLFREISTEVFVKVYYSGRVTISQDDIIPYLKELNNEQGKQLWTDNTIYRLATKYLSLLTKLHFVSEGRIKHIQYVRPSSESIVLFLYFLKLDRPNEAKILKHPLLPLMFVGINDVQERLKKLSLKGYFNMSYNGVDLNVELTHTYNQICDVLFK